MRTLHVDADTWMHRLAPRTKLIALAVVSVAVFMTDRLPVPGLAVLIAAGLYFGCGLSAREAVRRLRPVLLTIVVVALFSLLFNPILVVAMSVFRLTALVLLAAVVTATTTIGAIVDEITALAGPLEKAGWMRAADVGLAVGLVVRFVPEILDRYGAIRDAYAARGLKFRISTALVPLVILTLRDADSIAAAIEARGIRQDRGKRA
jgi:biotin transport system permease protein